MASQVGEGTTGRRRVEMVVQKKEEERRRGDKAGDWREGV